MHANPRIYKDVMYPELSYSICGLCFTVHNDLGRFRSESQYCDALEELLKTNNLKYLREKIMPPSFKGEGNRNIPDFIIEDKIVLDLKAKRLVTKDDYFQMKRYLFSSKYKLGVIVNFRQKYLTPKRVLTSKA